MRLTLAFILSIVFAVGLVAFGFTFYQSSTERNKLIQELEIRTEQVAEDILRGDTFYIGKLNQNNIERFADSINKRYNLLGFAVYYNIDSIISNNSTHNFIKHSLDYISQSINADTSLGNFFTIGGKSIYQYIRPVNRADISNNAVVFYTDADYIDSIIGEIWYRNFIRWFIQAFFDISCDLSSCSLGNF